VRGSPLYQAKTVLSVISAIGQSKHDAKIQARNQGAQTWHQVGKQLGIHSYSTMTKYVSVAKNLLLFTRSEFGVRDITKLESQHIQAFLEQKINDGVKYSTYQGIQAGIEKLEKALNCYSEQHGLGKEYSFREAIDNVKEIAKEVLDHSIKSGAFFSPKNVIDNIQDRTFQILANAQYSAGLRLSELNMLKPEQFKQNNIFVVVKSKGGLTREVQFRDKKAYQEFKNLALNNLNEDGKFSFNKNAYRLAVAQSAKQLNEKYTADHSFRHNYAQERFSQLLSQGKTELEAKLQISQELGHSRPDIVDHYLR
jgi:site-specific recombinase XerD